MANNHGGRRAGAGRPAKENQKEKQNKYIQFICSEVEKETILKGLEAYNAKTNSKISLKQYIKKHLLEASEVYLSADYEPIKDDQELSQYYTKPEIAELCVSYLDLSAYGLIVEPSAGTGSFLEPLKRTGSKIIALDVEPKEETIQKKDFFDFLPERSKILVVGNPPFGKNNTLAVRFINHSALFAETIAFILPVSFKKDFLLNQLNEHLELVAVYDLPAESFVKSDGTAFNYETAFFVFQYSEAYRRELKEVKAEGFSFTKNKDQADIFIIRKGKKTGIAGLASEVPADVFGRFFIKFDDEKKIVPAIELLNNYNWNLKTYSMNTINKADVINILNGLSV